MALSYAFSKQKECVAQQDACEVGIGLGSNLGFSAEIVRSALQTLRQHPHMRLCAYSSLYLSRPLEMESRNWFVNAVALIRTVLSPRALMMELQRMEIDFGRIRDSSIKQRVYEDRALDLDILFYGKQVVREPDLTIPHPRMLKRLFVLKPLAEIIGDLQHPLSYKEICLLARNLQDKEPRQTVVRMADRGATTPPPFLPCGHIPEFFPLSLP